MAIGTPVIKRRSHTPNQNRELCILFITDDPRNPAHLIPLSNSELQSAAARPFRGADNGWIRLLREQTRQAEEDAHQEP